MKTCTKCGIKKPLIEGFSVHRQGKEGRRAACKECSSVAARAWRLVNPERVKARCAEWHRANPEKAKELNIKWYRGHPEVVRAKNAKWARDNPEERRATKAKRRTAKLAYEGRHYTASDVSQMFKSQNGLCAYCKALLDIYHVDHIVPLSRGGSNGVENICLACPPCNLSKHSKLLGYEWCACDVAKEESL